MKLILTLLGISHIKKIYKIIKKRKNKTNNHSMMIQCGPGLSLLDFLTFYCRRKMCSIRCINSIFFFSHTFLEPLQFTTGQRGCLQLLFNQYAYVKNAITGTRIIWKCSRKVFLCDSTSHPIMSTLNRSILFCHSGKSKMSSESCHRCYQWWKSNRKNFRWKA